MSERHDDAPNLNRIVRDAFSDLITAGEARRMAPVPKPDEPDNPLDRLAQRLAELEALVAELREALEALQEADDVRLVKEHEARLARGEEEWVSWE